MEKTFTLDQKETAMLGTLEQDNLRLNARWGQLTREREDIDRRILASDEQQRGFLRRALADRGIEGAEMAQILNGQLVCRLPDQPNIAVNGEPVKAEKANGAPIIDLAA